MNLTGIIAIAGKPGLYKVLAQSKNGLIVESLIDGKRIPAYATHKVSALEDISVYTYTEDIPLSGVYRAIYDKENGGEAIAHNSKANELKAYLMEVLPDYDQERVYNSDLKKLFNWYNLLHKSGNLVLKEEETEEEAPKAEAKEEVKAEEAPKKKVAPKKKTTTAKKATEKKPAAKKATTAKKTTAKKAAPKKDAE